MHQTPLVAPDQQEIESRARKGAGLLDAHDPDWAFRINRDRLDMDSNCHCIIGQLHGSYGEGRSRYFSDGDARSGQTIQHGFNLSIPHSKENHDRYTEEYRLLTNAWLKQIDARIESNCFMFSTVPMFAIH